MPRRKPKKNSLSKEQELNLKDKLDGIVLASFFLLGEKLSSTREVQPDGHRL